MDLKSVLEQNREFMKALPSRPSPDALEKAQKAVAAIEKNLVSTLEDMQASTASDMGSEELKTLQAKKRYIANTEADMEKRKFLPVIELEDRYRHYEEIIRRAELALVDKDAQAEADRIIKQESARKLMEEIEEVIQTGATEVDWSNRDLDYLPESFGKMSTVTTLNLSRNFLEVLPDAIAGLRKLQVLNVSGNRLAKLPDSIGALSQLRTLDASRNELVELPDTICKCSRLEELNLSFNKLTKLPEEFATSLPNLRKLNISLNKIKHLPPNFAKLQELTHLDAHFNQLREVSSSIGHLSRLQFLDVSNNFADLVALPASMGNLSSLVEVNLSNNQIHELPVEFGKLTQLVRLSLDGNPWRDPPLELVHKKDHKLLLSYLEQRYQMSLTATPETNFFAEWSKWVSSAFGGNFEFTAWLNGIMSGMPVAQLTGPQQTNSGAGPLQGTELDALKGREAEDDLEGGSGHSSLPVSSLGGRPIV